MRADRGYHRVGPLLLEGMTSPHPLAAWVERHQSDLPRYRRRRLLERRRARRQRSVSRVRYS